MERTIEGLISCRRKAKGWSHGDLAKALGYSNVGKGARKLYDLERGVHHKGMYEKVFDALGIGLEEVYQVVRRDWSRYRLSAADRLPDSHQTITPRQMTMATAHRLFSGRRPRDGHGAMLTVAGEGDTSESGRPSSAMAEFHDHLRHLPDKRFAIILHFYLPHPLLDVAAEIESRNRLDFQREYNWLPEKYMPELEAPSADRTIAPRLKRSTIVDSAFGPRIALSEDITFCGAVRRSEAAELAHEALEATGQQCVLWSGADGAWLLWGNGRSEWLGESIGDEGHYAEHDDYLLHWSEAKGQPPQPATQPPLAESAPPFVHDRLMFVYRPQGHIDSLCWNSDMATFAAGERPIGR